MAPKLAIIMRGLPGSGKSHWIAQFIESLPAAAGARLRRQGLFSTDHYFYHGNEYRFNAKKLSEYHQRNLCAFIEALARGEPMVICDNTNLCQWEYMAYGAAAKALGYQLRLVLLGDPQDLAHQQLC
ncbi:MAG: AAA family ATPase, partial [Shewanella sp.]